MVEQEEEEQLVIVYLIDHPDTNQVTFQHLKFKFDSQQFAKLLWFVRMERAYEYLPIEYAKDKSFIVENMIKNPYMIYDLIDPMLKLNVEVALEYLIWTDGDCSKQALILQDAMNDMKFVTTFLKSHAHLMETSGLHRLIIYFPSVRQVFDDREHFLEIVKYDGLVVKNVLDFLSLATDRIKSDRLIIEECVQQDGYALSLASKELRNDRELILKAVKRHGLVLKDLDNKQWLSDREIVMQAAKQNGNIIAKIPPFFVSDREIAVLALSSNSMCLEYLPDEMKEDRELVLLAVKSDKPIVAGQSCLRYASETMKNDKEVLLEAAKHNPFSVCYAKYMDAEILKSAIMKKPSFLEKIPETFHSIRDEILNDKEFLYELCEQKMDQSFSLFLHIGSELQYDKDMVIKILKKNPQNYWYIPRFMKLDDEIHSCLQNGPFHEYGSLGEETEIREALSKDGLLIYRIDESFISEELAIIAVQQNGQALNYVPERFKMNKLVQLEAAKSNGFYLEFSEELYQARLNSDYYGAKL